jgi:hypothetical protein
MLIEFAAYHIGTNRSFYRAIESAARRYYQKTRAFFSHGWTTLGKTETPSKRKAHRWFGFGID